MSPTEEAFFYITNWYPHMGTTNTRALIEGLTSPDEVMTKAASELRCATPSEAFPDRHKEHIAYALDMVASSRFLLPAAAVGSVYLATRFEYYFRVLSGRLKADGTWKSGKDQEEMLTLLADKRLNKRRIDSVALAYKIMKTNPALPLAKVCKDLDAVLFPKEVKMPDGKSAPDIGDRIEYLRHRSAHGYWGDISAEADFYSLMTVIVFYNQ